MSRRTISTPNRWRGSSASSRIPGTGGRHPRSLLPRQCRGLDSRTRPRRGHPWEAITRRARAERTRLAQEEKTSRPPEDARARVRVVQVSPRARQAKSKARLASYEKMLDEGSREVENVEISFAGTATRHGRHRSAGAAQGLRRQPADRTCRSSSAGRHRRGDRAQRRGQDHAVRMIPARSSRRGNVARRRNRPLAYGTEPRCAAGDANVWRQSPAAARFSSRQAHRDSRATSGVQLQGCRPAEAREGPVGRRAQPRASRAHSKNGDNVLLLDEPTTTSTSIRCARSRTRCSFAGCAVVISHRSLVPRPHQRLTSWRSKAIHR